MAVVQLPVCARQHAWLHVHQRYRHWVGLLQRFHLEGYFLPEGNFSVRKEIEFGRKLEGNLIFGKEIRRKLYFSYNSLKRAILSPKINEKFYRISYPMYFFPYSLVLKLCRNSEVVRFCLRCNVLVFRNWQISLILQLHYV